MTRIKNLADQIMDELHDAKSYAEEYLTYKAKNEYEKDASEWAARYKEMSTDELKHALYLHDRAVAEIEELRKVMTPPEEMLQKWEHAHREYSEKAAWIKQMLAM